MHPITSPHWIKPSPWKTISRKKRIARESLATTRTTLSHFTRSTILQKEVEATAHTNIMVISAKGVETITVVIGTTEDSRETIQIVITMETMVATMVVLDTTMETTVITVIIQGTCPISPASSVRRPDTLRMTVRRISLLMPPNPIHSRKDKRTTCMWRKW
jgi:hypothetical protein